jgi:hypothetical protein
VRTLLLCALVLALPLLATGCGNDRADGGDLTTVPAGSGSRVLRYPNAGLTVKVPKAFKVSLASAPELFRASLNESFVSVFVYRRKEQLPKTRDELRTARDRLVKAAKARDKTFDLEKSTLTRAGGAPAIELLGDQTLFRGELRLRSLHVYKGNGEYVIELVAPRSSFGRLDRATFPGIRGSLKLTGRVKAAAPKRAAKGTKKKKRGSGSP